MPFPVDGSGALVKSLELVIHETLSLPVVLVSGVATEQDMMRGEETQLVGIMAHPQFARFASGCRIILPGTHSKHVLVSDGEVVEFHTYMSGELFDVLCQHSVLRFTTRADEHEFEPRSFAEGVRASRGTGLAGSLFQARTRAVLQSRTPQSHRDFLSGLLIGSELCDLMNHSEGSPVILAAPDAMAARYLRAVECLGFHDPIVTTSCAQFDEAVVLGHQLILRHHYFQTNL
jgi:2-dehydro-3-deoxygalactonokinase